MCSYFRKRDSVQICFILTPERMCTQISTLYYFGKIKWKKWWPGIDTETFPDLFLFHNHIAKYQERALLNPHKGIGVACASRTNCIVTAPYSFPQCSAFLNRDKPYWHLVPLCCGWHWLTASRAEVQQVYRRTGCRPNLANVSVPILSVTSVIGPPTRWASRPNNPRYGVTGHRM